VNRKAALAVLAVALLCIGALVMVVKRSNSDSTRIDPEVIAVSYPIVIPDLCRALVEVNAGDRTAAYNSFYEQAHASLHVLSADVDRRGERGRQIGMSLRQAKSKIEAEIATFPPTLQADLTTLIVVTGDALVHVGYSGETTC
jgi:hypothetical protein